MKITELLDVKSIALNVNVSSKDETIDKLIDLMYESGKISDKSEYKKGILAREALSTTGIGDGIAIPHAQVATVKKAGLAAMTIQNGVDYNSLDGKPVYLCFMIAAPQDGGSIHLQALAKLSTLLMNEEFRNELMNAKSAEQFIEIINQEEAKKDDKEKNVLTAKEIEDCEGIIIAADKNVEMARFDGKPVLSVSVTQGIQKPEELIQKVIDHQVPIYHHDGSTVETIENSEGVGRSIYKHLMNGVSHMLPFVIGGGILIALAFLFDDYSIDPANFGKNTPLAAYLKTIGEQAFGLMLPVLAGYISYSIADRPGLAVGFIGGMVAKMGCTFTNPAGGDVNAGFLGALLAGFVGGYLVIGLKKVFSKLPQALEGIKPILLYPVIGILLVSVITTFINPFVGAINDALNGFLNGMGGTSKVLLGMIVAGMQSTDMGGPINKASYVFATSQLAEGNFEIMAAVMAGGMIPPLAIALSTTFFKNRWTKDERNSGLVNYVMGLAFISEGAIPFAAKDPLRVIPSCIVGSAVAGALSMFFGCTLRAPHGGIFVLPTIGNPLMYALAILIGAIAGCLVLSILKKPLKGN